MKGRDVGDRLIDQSRDEADERREGAIAALNGQTSGHELGQSSIILALQLGWGRSDGHAHITVLETSSSKSLRQVLSSRQRMTLKVEGCA
jgi:hypothetical protein